MKIDVVIPAFRDERVLETLDSIQRCDLDCIDIRVIVQIGSSGEQYERKIREKFPCVEIGSEKDYGIFSAINIGLKKCKGDLILTLGSDDRISNQSCFQLVRTQFLAGYQCILTDMQYTDENWRPLRFWPARQITLYNYILGYQHAHFSLFLSPFIYRDVGLFNAENKVNADYEFFLYLTRYLKSNKIQSKTISVTCIQMKQGGNSSSSFKKIISHQLHLIRFACKEAPYLLPSVLLFKWFHKVNQLLRRNQ